MRDCMHRVLMEEGKLCRSHATSDQLWMAKTYEGRCGECGSDYKETAMYACNHTGPFLDEKGKEEKQTA